LQLFGGSAFTKDYLYGLKDYSAATWSQNFVASITGSISSIVISQPLDVIKSKFVTTVDSLLRHRTARIQNQNFESRQSGGTVIRELIKNEGASAFFKVSWFLCLDFAQKVRY
jgi:hypothetical protein